MQTNIKDQTLLESKEEVKGLMKLLKGTTDETELEKARNDFKDVIKRANPLVIAMAENELVKEGFSHEDLMSACDVHLLLFRDAIENPNLKVPDWHPIHQFQDEHRYILQIMEEFRDLIRKVRRQGEEGSKAELERLLVLAKKLMEVENHNVRQENTLFPILEKHGIVQPPAIMWTEHTDMKVEKKEILQLLKDRSALSFEEFCEQLYRKSTHLLEKFSTHTQKEEHILYMAALEVITDEEWKDIKEECDNLGYFELQAENTKKQ